MKEQTLATRRRGVLRRNLSGWLLMLPGLILFGFFVWEPLLESIRLSLYQTQGVNLVKFVGFENYLKVFRNPDFLPALRNTFLYTFYSLLIGFLVPMVIALLINEAVRMKGLFRVAVYFPNIMPGLAAVFAWLFIFRPTGTGALNSVLHLFGAAPQPWLQDPKLTIPLIIITLTWKGAGATALIYLAGISGINRELYEAATIDGAQIFARVRYITLPGIWNLARTMLVLQIIAVFQIFYEPLVLTDGGPNNASITLMQLVYSYAFDHFKYSSASALSVVVFAILLVLTFLQGRIGKERED